MIQMFKIVNGLDKVNWHNPPEFSINAVTRGHNKRIRRQLVKSSTSRYQFFTNRIANNWNKLTQETIDSRSVNSFKNAYDKLF